MRVATSVLFVLAIASTSCKSSPSAPPPAVKMPTSPAASALIERARQFRPAVKLPSPLPHSRPLPHPWVLAASHADGASIAGAVIHPHLGKGTVKASVAYPAHADGSRALTLTRSGASLSIALQGASAAAAEYASGYLVYRGGLSAGGDVIVRPSSSGFEDYFVFDKKPASPRVEYEVALPPAVAGLRLTSNVLEMLDAKGTPLFHVSPPYLVDSNGATATATLSVSGCAVDRNPQPPWGRAPTPPGARSCRVVVAWDDTKLEYPAVLDPTWATADAMAVPRAYFDTAVLASRTPQLIVAFGGFEASTAISRAVELFNPDTDTWSPGPPMNMAHLHGASVVFNTTGAPSGDELFVAGGFTGNSPPDPRTEILSQDATGHLAWSYSAPLPRGRGVHQAELMGTRVLIVGGQLDDWSITKSCELYDTLTHSFVSPAPPDMNVPRIGFGSASLPNGQGVIVAGGDIGDTPPDITVLSSAELFNGAQWVPLPDMPSPHEGFDIAMTLPDGRVLVAGGGSSLQDVSNQAAIYTYSPTAPYGSWTSLGSFTEAGSTMLPAAVMANGAVLFALGGTSANVNLTDAALFDPGTGAWSKTNSTVPHMGGGAATARRTDGRAETLLFGGTPDNRAPQGVTEKIGLDAKGTACTDGETCASGGCANGACQGTIGEGCASDSECVSGFCTLGTHVCAEPKVINIDATALSNKGLLISGGTNILDTSQVRQVRLAAGSYPIQVYTGVVSSVSFTVNPDGTVDYDASLDGVLSGRGTDTLKINGRRITINATHLSQSELELLVYNYENGVATHKIVFDTATTHDFVLLPISSFDYRFVVGSTMFANFGFDIDLPGNVHIPPDDAALASGEGTTTLTIQGAHVSIYLPPNVGDTAIDANNGPFSIPLTAGQTNDVYVLPVADGSPSYHFKVGDVDVSFTIDAAGNVTGDPAYLDMFQVHGDAAPYCGAEEAKANEGGWSVTPVQCQDAQQQLMTSAITVQAPAPSTTSPKRRSGTTRFPNQLPLNLKPAGGDPVLGDGEFFLQRTDASLAGYGLHYEFRRTYRSGLDTPSPLGYGWNHNYNQRILGNSAYTEDMAAFGDVINTDCGGAVQFQDGEGSLVRFVGSSWSTSPQLVQHLVAERGPLRLDYYVSSHEWRLIRPDGVVSRFDAAGFLSSITDLAGNTLQFRWDKPTEPPYPTCDPSTPPATCDRLRTEWKQKLVDSPLGQRRRLASVSDASRTVHYIYYQNDPELIDSNNALRCISLDTTCTSSNVLASFSSDSYGRLTAVAHGPEGAPAIESYKYHDPAPKLPEKCLPSADIYSYCVRFCDPRADDSLSCDYLGQAQKEQDFCGKVNCVDPSTGEACWAPEDGGKEYDLNDGQPGDLQLCCADGNTGTVGIGYDLCLQYYGLVPDCFYGCEYKQQCKEVRNGTTYAIYAFGLSSELPNDITDVYDKDQNVVVHNEYGSDRAYVSFDRVTSQRIGPGTADNVISFEYHDFTIEDRSEPDIYTSASGPERWPGPYSPPNPTVQSYRVPFGMVLDLCPHVCKAQDSTGTCIYDYDPPTQQLVEIPPNDPRSAVVIHDLHGLTRIQYLDFDSDLTREVTVETGEITDYDYFGPSGILSAIRRPSGVRTCLEHDALGRVIQSSLVAAPNYSGTATTQATTFRYDPQGQLADLVRNALGTPVRTHYQRDTKERVTRVDQDVRQGEPALSTLYRYDGETPPNGILETPTQITYPDGRIDKFSSFDPSMGGPRSIVIDSGATTPEQRYVTYDTFGRVLTEGEVGRFSHQYVYGDPNDIGRLTAVGHRPDDGTAWIYKQIHSHLVDGQDVIDSIIEPTRTTNFTNVGRFPTQKDVVATAAPPGTTLPATQTSCYDYSVDGRLEAMILPEGNGLKYDYAFGPGGTSVSARKGYGVDTSGAWAAGCRSHTAPTGDPGMGLLFAREFHPGGFIDKEVEPTGSYKQFVTDGFGRVIQISSVSNPAHADPMPVVQFGYDSKGQRIWEARLKPDTGMPTNAYKLPTVGDPNLLSFTEYEYDLIGRVVTEKVHVLETGEVLLKTIGYDDLSDTKTIIDRGVTTTVVNDHRGRLVSSTAPDTSVTRVVHALDTDTVTLHSNTKGDIQRVFNYDTRGRLLHVDDVLSGRQLYGATYDDDDNQLTETRLGQGALGWKYDAFGRLVEEDRTLNGATAASKYEYDGNDRVTRYTDAVTSSWSMTFTGWDAPLTVTDPLGRSGTYTYETSGSWPHGLVASMTEPNGRVTSFAYDSEARLTDIYDAACPSGRAPWECGVLQPRRHMTYDEGGHVKQVDVPDRESMPHVPSVFFTYDSLDRLAQEQVGDYATVLHPLTDAGRTETSQVSYIPPGQAEVVATVTRHYDNTDRLHTVELNGNTLATYDFGIGIGGPLSLTYANGATATFGYDNMLRQTGIDVSFAPPNTQPQAVASLHEAFGSDSIPRMRRRKIGSSPTWTDVFQVDEDGRISKENLRLNNVPMPTGEIENGDVDTYMSGPRLRTYVLDNIGNIKKVTTNNSVLLHTVDALSRLTQLGDDTVNHDGTDNLTGTSAPNDKVTFEFDQFTGTLTKATSAAGTTTYEYDALDRRRIEHRPDGTDEIYLWDGNQLIGHGDPNQPKIDVPGDDIDSHIASVDGFGTGAQWFYHQGPDQSVLAVTGSAGLIEGYTYSAFGELSIWDANGNARSTSIFGNIFQFQGQVYDAATSTYSMRARQYRPEWGRFLSPDPLSVAGGPSLYAFTGSQPLQTRDPQGLLPSNWKKPESWILEWMSTWDPTPGAAGQVFLFAPESSVANDLVDEAIAKLNAFAPAGTSYYLQDGEVHRVESKLALVAGTYYIDDRPSDGARQDRVMSSVETWAPVRVDTVVAGIAVVAGRLYSADRILADQVYTPRFDPHLLRPVPGLDISVKQWVRHIAAEVLDYLAHPCGYDPRIRCGVVIPPALSGEAALLEAEIGGLEAAGAGTSTIARITPGSLPAAEESSLLQTLKHIDAGTTPGGALAKKWATPFKNWAGDLPGASGTASPYLEYRVAPPAGTTGPGVLRVVVDQQSGDMYYTWTHYGDTGAPSFVRIR